MAYELLTIAIFVVFALAFYLETGGINKLVIAAIFIWPFAMLADGQTNISAYIPHMIAGLIVLFLGVYFFAKDHIGGGVAKGATVIALWVPSALLLPIFVPVLILGCVSHFIVMSETLNPRRKSFEHLATIIFSYATLVMLVDLVL